MIVRTERGKRSLYVYCPQSLREFIDDPLIEGQHLLRENFAEPMIYQAVEINFRLWR